MFIKKVITNGRIFYFVYETHKPEGRRRSTSRIVAPLGHEPNLGKAYRKALGEHLKAADRLARLERALTVLGPEAEYRGGR